MSTSMGVPSSFRTPKASDATALKDWYENGYVQAFVAGDAKKLAHMYAGVPSMFMITNPDGSYTELSAFDEAGLFNIYEGMLTKLAAAGYASAKMDPICIQQLTPHTFVITTKGIRYKADGSELMRIGTAAYFVKSVSDVQAPFRITCTVGEFLPPQ